MFIDLHNYLRSNDSTINSQGISQQKRNFAECCRVMRICNSSTWEAELGGSQIQGQHGLCIKTLFFTHRVGENICQLYIRQRTDNQNIQGT
jgi:hypothetical protein